MSWEVYGDTSYLRWRSGEIGGVPVVSRKWTPGAEKPHRNQINDPQWETCIDDLNARLDRMLRESALKIMGPHTD